MLTKPMDVLEAFPVRKTKAQKAAFRRETAALASGWGYPVTEEKGSFGVHNLVIGDPEEAKYLVTAHYDTCARLPFPNLITPCDPWPFLAYQLLVAAVIVVPAFLVSFLWAFAGGSPWMGALLTYLTIFGTLLLMLIGPANRSNANDNTSGVVTVLEIARNLPENQRKQVCFVLFDLEEAGLLGSSAYRKAHKKAVQHQLVLNLDCVGEGDHIRLFPTKALKKHREKGNALEMLTGTYGEKNIRLVDKGFAVYPSDQQMFPYGVGICSLNQSKWGLYLGRIHTPRDTILDESNVNLLCAAIQKLICRDTAQ